MSSPNTGAKASTPVDEGSGNGEGDSGADKGTKTPAQVLNAILGDDPKFADEFFGEPGNMTQPLPPAPGEVPEPGEDSGMMASHEIGSPPAGLVTSPVGGFQDLSIDDLVVRQLQEDLKAYRYDLEFARAQLHPNNSTDITAAETRIFQLRMLDLGHQMRMINHRIQMMQIARFPLGRQGAPPGSGVSLANTVWGPYPPGTVAQPIAGAPGGMPSSGYYGGPNPLPAMLPQSSVAQQYPGYAEQDRRRPGRPLGSRNRYKMPADVGGGAGAFSTSVPNQATPIASAAALATAGAKRAPPSEIHVATPRGEPSGFTPLNRVPYDESSSSKRMRLDFKEESTQNEITAAGSGHPDDYDDTEDDGMEPNNANITSSTTAAPYVPANAYADAIASYVQTAPVPPEAPVGDKYQRLGFWRCRLCNSQKYLNAPPPKSPSEPGTWPLKDVSKMITHCTRMHGEHNNAERCMELGAALHENSGPFRHWLTVTKKEKALSVADVESMIDTLENGQMPMLLRKVSASAANFPSD